MESAPYVGKKKPGGVFLVHLTTPLIALNEGTTCEYGIENPVD